MVQVQVHPDNSNPTNLIQNGYDQIHLALDLENTLVKPIDNSKINNLDNPANTNHDCESEKCEQKYSLHFSAQKNDYTDFGNKMQDHLRTSPNVDTRGIDCEGYTILMRLINNHDVDTADAIKQMEEVVTWFISENVNLKGEHDLREYVNMQVPSDGNRTALHFAADLSVHGVIEFLLLCGANPNVKDQWGETVLHLVAKADKDTDEKLIQRANPSICAKLLLDAMSNKDVLDTEGRTPLETAVNLGYNADMVQLLIDNGCSPCPQLMGINNQDSNDKPDANGRRLILHHAIDNCYDEDTDNVDCVRRLIKVLSKEEINLKCDEVKWKGRNAFHMAAHCLCPNVLKLLVEQEDADIFAVDDDHRTSLHILANLGWNAGTKECVDVLLDKKSKFRKSSWNKQDFFDKKDTNGETALDISVRRDSVPLSTVLIMNAPYYAPHDWMTRELLEKIYYKVPEALIPVMEEYINFDNKNYEANDEIFTANIGPITGFDENEYKDDAFPEKFTRETDLLSQMMDSPFVTGSEEDNMLEYPLVRIFIMQKWKLLRSLFWIGLLVKFVWIVFYLYFVIDVFWFQFPYDGKPTSGSTTTQASSQPTETKYLLFGQSVCALIIVALTIIIVSTKTIVSVASVGFKKSINPYALFHLGFSCTVCVTMTTLCIIGVQPWHYVGTAVTVILAAFIGIWELRSAPLIGIYADVFFIATKNFILVMTAFIPLFIGFGIAISLMLRGNKSFDELHWNLIKMLVMMLGEINFNDLFYGSEFQSSFRTFAILILIVFVVCVPIVVFNLLLGFTISDVQALKSESENKVLISNLEEIILLERLILSPLAQKLLPQAFLWSFMLATRKWTTESEYFGHKLEIQIQMEDLPKNVREKIRQVASKRPSKKENSDT